MKNRKSIQSIMILISALLSINAAGQLSDVPFYQTHELNLKIERIKPHRIELKEISINEKDSSLESYTYVTVDPTKQFGEKMLLINWTTLTKFGSGLDINYVSALDLRTRFRITPRSIPFGILLESHAFQNEVNIVEANADVKNHREEIESIYPNPPGLIQKPTVNAKYESYNEITFPYVLATMDLEVGMKFILPGFNGYSSREYFNLLNVVKQSNYYDLKGNTYNAFEVKSVKKSSIEELHEEKEPLDSSKLFVSYYVSNEEPFFLGKEWYTINKKGEKILKNTWTLKDWQLIKVSSLEEQQEMIEEWENIKEKIGWTIPWYPNN